MRRANYFVARGLPLLPRTGSTGVPAERSGSRLGDRGVESLAELLRSLRGREVLLQVGNRQVAGRLLQPDPVLLVGANGRATQVRLEAIVAVDY